MLLRRLDRSSPPASVTPHIPIEELRLVGGRGIFLLRDCDWSAGEPHVEELTSCSTTKVQKWTPTTHPSVLELVSEGIGIGIWVTGGASVYTQRENQSQEGHRYIPSMRTNHRRSVGIYPAWEPITGRASVYTQCENQSQPHLRGASVLRGAHCQETHGRDERQLTHNLRQLTPSYA
eukprot:5913470-Pyramimonas_sp.AAC.2